MENEVRFNPNPDCNKCEQPMEYNEKYFMFDCTKCQVFIASKFFKQNEIGKFVSISLQKATTVNRMYSEPTSNGRLSLRVNS